MLVDSRGRRYLIDLDPKGSFQYHAGTLRHQEIIGAPDGSVLCSSAGSRLVALRPRLADYILRMKRGPQVVYPKDVGPMLHWGDVGAGMRVVEAGTGSGALTLALIRAVGPTGSVVSVEHRPDHAAHARKVIERFLGEVPANLDLRVGRVEEELASETPDRVVLDLPEPWEAVPVAAESLADGGVLTAYLPTVPQVAHLRDALRYSKRFADLFTFEILLREWAADGRSVRPSHQMVGHTGFVTVARHTRPLEDED